MKAFAAFLAVLAGIAASQARIITVDDDGPADFNTIQAAIDDANDGDTVSVAAGTYDESIVMKDGVGVCGAGADVTTIDGGGTGHVVTFSFVSGSISGFTITGSSLTDHYAGIYVYASDVNIEDNVVVDNQFGLKALGNSQGLIRGNRVISNAFAMTVEGSDPTIANNTIAMNPWAGVVCGECSPAIIGNTITRNGYYGIVSSGPLVLQIIRENMITHHHTGITVYGDRWSSYADRLLISYNNIWETEEPYFEHYGDPDWGYFGPFDPQPGIGEISLDPLFADADNGDYHLKSQGGRYDPNSVTWVIDDVTSLCIDAGAPMSPIGLEPFPNGGRVNMGAYGGTTEASKSYFGEPPCETIVAGDVNGDCKVNYLDFALMALHWMEDHN